MFLSFAGAVDRLLDPPPQAHVQVLNRNNSLASTIFKSSVISGKCMKTYFKVISVLSKLTWYVVNIKKKSWHMSWWNLADVILNLFVATSVLEIVPRFIQRAYQTIIMFLRVNTLDFDLLSFNFNASSY